ncbi:homoserine O-acetyltransferase [Friedmanniella endophytica]|uniref:Homoserine O-acetyltransferase n=1 Tax=Microlunatus kandeliicorticis TaxID=1759536 RepID=A0A7W3P4J3_9ACTN|nr:homoserine O-acetyltransferase [Microlunatus kandeliicorticis]
MTLAYETWGTPQRDDTGAVVNAVLVLHALTGDAHLAGPAGPDQPTPGWWEPLVGPRRPLDTDRWWVVAANVLGGCRGSTGPASPAPDGRRWGSRFPELTARDQVAAEARLADALGVRRFAAVIGASMGGMRALEWVITHPDRVGSALVVAVGAAASADQIGTQTTQQAAITGDPGWQGGDYTGEGPLTGLALARRIAHLTYRSEGELEARFGRRVQPDGRFAVTSYLEHHGAKLVGRFDAGSYVVLTQTMNTHDVGRGRGGIATALGGVEVPVVVAGVDSDRLYPLHQQQELVDLIPTAERLHVITSAYGHDGFLIEADQVGPLVRRTLGASSAAPGRPPRRLVP